MLEILDESRARRVLILSTVAFTMLFAVWLMFGVLGVPIKKELGLTQVPLRRRSIDAARRHAANRLPEVSRRRLDRRRVGPGNGAPEAPRAAIFSLLNLIQQG